MNQNYLNSSEAEMLLESGGLYSGISRIIGISMVKNESDIIEVFVRHNIQFLDAIVILDNGSTDGTGKILDELVHEGLPIVRLFSPRTAFHQDQRTTNLMRTVSLLFSPTRVCPLDADEFISCPSKEEFRRSILNLDDNTLGFFPFKSYVPYGNQAELPERNILRRIIHRRRQEDHQWYKVAIPRKLHSNPLTIIEMGNHDVIFPGRTNRHHFTQIALAHFPVRSSSQIQRKIIVNWLSILARGGHGYGVAWHWEKYYQVFKDMNYAPVDITYIANHYSAVNPSHLVLQPLQSIDTPLDLTALHANDSLLSAVINFTEELIKTKNNSGTDPNGAWMPLWDSSKNSIDFPPFEYIANLFRPRSVLEIGSAHSLNLRIFKDRSASRVLGIEDEQLNKVEEKSVEFLHRNLTLPLDLKELFDLVICSEVIQNLPEVYEATLIDSIVKHASQAILFSAARTSQPGVTYPRNTTVYHWINEFRVRGWVPLPFHSLAFRACATLSCLRSNPILFVREVNERKYNCPGFFPYDLEFQDNINWKWPKQKTGIYLRPQLGDEILSSWN